MKPHPGFPRVSIRRDGDGFWRVDYTAREHRTTTLPPAYNDRMGAMRKAREIAAATSAVYVVNTDTAPAVAR